MNLPRSPLAGLDVVELGAGSEPSLQAFFEANPLYFQAVHGEPVQPGEAHEEIHGELPAGWPFTKKWVFGYRDAQGGLAAMANVVTDLLALGVWHVGTFIVATSRHGNGDARRLYEGLESWARENGARWMRLGVVAGHARAERFWEGRGYREVRRREGVVMGRRTNVIRVMAKPLHGQSLDDYYALVPRDRDPADVIRALEMRRTQALVEKNLELADRMHAPEYRLITPAGKALDKAGYLEALRSGDLTYVAWEPDAMDVRVGADMALVRYRATLRFPSGKVVHCWHTDSYELRGGEWLAVWSQATAIHPPA